VVVVHVDAMRKALVPVLETFNRQGEGAALGLVADIATAISAAVAPAVAVATAGVATSTICIPSVSAAVVVTTAVVTATVTAIVVASALLAADPSTTWASWLLLWGMSGGDCQAEHLKLPLHRQNVGGV
jgi:hypothetical protein